MFYERKRLIYLRLKWMFVFYERKRLTSIKFSYLTATGCPPFNFKCDPETGELTQDSKQKKPSSELFKFSPFRITPLALRDPKTGELTQDSKKKKPSSELVVFFCFESCGESRIRTCEVLTADLQSALVGRLSISPRRQI